MTDEELQQIEEAEARLKKQRLAIKNRMKRLQAHQSPKTWYR